MAFLSMRGVEGIPVDAIVGCKEPELLGRVSYGQGERERERKYERKRCCLRTIGSGETT